MDPLDHYVAAFSRLKTDRGNQWSSVPETRFQAPHKAILLLTVLDKIAQGTLRTNLIEIDRYLGELFHSYWSNVMPPDRRGNIAMPFFHLQSDGFWQLLWRSEKEPSSRVLDFGHFSILLHLVV